MKLWLVLLVLAMLFCISPAMAEETDNGQNNQLEVSISGVSGRDASNVRNRLSIYTYHGQQAPGAARLRFLHRRAEQEILRALAPSGYYQASVERQLERTDSGWQARYDITPGPVMQIRDVDIQITGEAREDDAFRNLINNLDIRSGQNLRHSNYENAKSRLRNLATERGYNEAAFAKSELRIDLEDYAADIVIHLESGPRFRFGQIRFSEAQLDEDVLQRFVPFHEGDYLTSDRLMELQFGMADSDYFSRVQIEPLWSEADDDKLVPVAVELEPNKRTYYRAGIGYGTDTGARLSFDQNRRWVNTRGHRFSTQFQLSESSSTVAANYIIPGQQPQTDQYAIRTSWRDEDVGPTRTEIFTLGVSWQTQLERTLRTMSLDWQDERDRFEGERRNTQFLIPSIQWNRVHTPDRLDVARGYRLNLGLRGATEQALSSTDFGQVTLSGKFVFSFAERFRFLTRGDFGTTAATDFDRIPTSLRFYAGGDTSIRGYGYRMVGPRNEEGEIVGGRHLAVGSAEVDYEFRPNWRVAAFIDSGNAFDNVNDAFRTGIGAGVRWQSPVGPIRIDLAHGLADVGDTIRLHLTLGPDL
ncbi:outer membrane protein assembly factor [Aliidiomarina minuta]|uniref:Translocation and assembly module subunit TamA n=1 Tax=Aliidiomarina minuta TaxID=880057 RepID=A0A432W3C3_9GAMM|nr:autotransporter assembly complex family protein [Aliidiomarina minuta]RUO23831.1 outer membrane protein assembly factor [Aliidiomarina minuta]